MFYLVAVVLLIGMSVPAHAYIDPGSGSYMLQLTMASILAVAFSIKLSWQRIKTFAANLFTGISRSRTGHEH